MVEISAHKLYEGYLVELEHVMGKDITYEDDINTICMQLFGVNWGGVFARDKMERILARYDATQPMPIIETKYCIFNLDTRAEGGSHWCACALINGLIYIYDSFGRGIDMGVSVNNSDLYDREQLIKETNCGPRSIAWLMVCDRHGIETAMYI